MERMCIVVPALCAFYAVPNLTPQLCSASRQGNKSAKQLYMDQANKKTKKVRMQPSSPPCSQHAPKAPACSPSPLAHSAPQVSNFGDFSKIEKVDLSYIPGREKRREDPRSVMLKIKKQKQDDERRLKNATDWTPTVSSSPSATPQLPRPRP